MNRDIVVIGGSSGAITSLRQVVRTLPAQLPAAIFVVIHTGPHAPSVLPAILSNAGVIPAAHAEDGTSIQPGRIYVAPPDHHPIVEPGRMRVTRGPRENRFRPAIDPLFRSAAAVYNSRVVGILLSGGGDDGVLGLRMIKQRGGTAIVQDPDEAELRTMPDTAMRSVTVDHVLRAGDMAAVIAGLVMAPASGEIVVSNSNPQRDSAEEGTHALDAGGLPGSSTPFTCPDCGGTLWELREGDMVRFQCHVGHRFTAEGMLTAHSDALESALWTALRTLEENAALWSRMADRANSRGMSVIAGGYQMRAEESRTRARAVRQVLVTDAAVAPSDG